MTKVTYSDMRTILERLFLGRRFDGEAARLCAQAITDSTFDGIHSHGINKVPSFVDRVDRGVVKIDARPEKIQSVGALEQWDGGQGIGIFNAAFCTRRAMEIADRTAVGCVALRNTNHWFRAGTYGWQAVDKNYALMAWTNTTANMPPWGAATRTLGNNPLVVAVPHSQTPVVLDMAMSQFSLGKLATYQRTGEKLPVPGGYTANGELTADAGQVMESGRALPMGFWKGSGLALVLDLLAALLSDGLATVDLSRQKEEHRVSQVFLAFRVQALHNEHNQAGADEIVSRILAHFHGARPAALNGSVSHPGQRTLKRRNENRAQGVHVDPTIWEQVLGLSR